MFRRAVGRLIGGHKIAISGKRLDDLLKKEKFTAKKLGVLSHSVEALTYQLYKQQYGQLFNGGHFNTSQEPVTGTVVSLMGIVGAVSKTFVDIGCGRSGGNSAILASQFYWNGLLVDASKGAVERVQVDLAHNQNLEFLQGFVTVDNINDLLSAYKDIEIDFLSIDIDSYDYWVFKAMKARPRVVTVEYNPNFRLRRVTVPLGSLADDAPKAYRGASLPAITQVAEEKGYRLIGCDKGGTNAFFVRNDLAPQLEAVPPERALIGPISRTTGLPVSEDAIQERLADIGERPLQEV